jgi:hypothetical protein
MKKTTKKNLPFYVKQYQEWKKKTPLPDTSISTQKLRSEIRKQLRNFREGDAASYALYHKWLEIKDFVRTRKRDELDEVYRLMWVPKGISDFRRLQPELIWVKDTITYEAIDFWGNRRTEEIENPDKLHRHWEILRTLVSSQTHDGTIGRRLSFLVRDRKSQKYLGVICISGDMLALSPRNASIWGKDTDNKIAQKAWASVIDHSANGSTIIPVQPFGSNYLGGKLLALLCLSKPVADLWKQEYGDTLVSVTTTSLWASLKSGLSQYDGLKPYWENVGTTKGTTPLKITDELYHKMRKWMWRHHPQEYHFKFVAKDPKGQIAERDNKNRAIEWCYKELGIKKDEYVSGHTRGIYFARLYKNTDAYLRGEIKEDQLEPAFDNSIEALTDFWRYGRRGDTSSKASEGQKGMVKHRLDKLLEDKKIAPHLKPQWYRSVAFKTWGETEKLWLSQVGR